MSYFKRKQKHFIYLAVLMLTAMLLTLNAPAVLADSSEDFLSAGQLSALISVSAAEETADASQSETEAPATEALKNPPIEEGLPEGAVMYAPRAADTLTAETASGEPAASEPAVPGTAASEPVVPETAVPETAAYPEENASVRIKASGVLPGRSVNVYIDGEEYEADAFLYNSVTYVGLRRFSNEMGADVSWNDAQRTAYTSSYKLALSVISGGDYINANGRYLWCSEGVLNIGGTLYVPVRQLCNAFGGRLYWDSGTYSVHITSGSGGIEHGYSYYKEDEVYWLSRIINAESQGEPLRGKIAVGNVVLNRVKSSAYPNTIYGVIFDKKFGVQFSPVSNGSIYNAPSEESIIAAKLCLDGATVSEDILYFINASIADNLWVTNACTYVTTIGSHDFYS